MGANRCSRTDGWVHSRQCEEGGRVHASDPGAARDPWAHARPPAPDAPVHAHGPPDRRGVVPAEPDGARAIRGAGVGTRRVPDRHRRGARARRRRLGALLPRSRRRAGRRADAVRGVPRRVLEGGRPVLRRPTDAEPLGLESARIISHSSPIATQVPHAAGIAYAMRYRGEEAAVGCWFGEGATSEGDWHEGLNFAGDPQAPRAVRVREQRVRDQRAPGQADGGARCREPRGGLRDAGRGRRRQRRARVLRGDAHRAGPRDRGRRPHADRVQDLPIPPAYLRRR